MNTSAEVLKAKKHQVQRAQQHLFKTGSGFGLLAASLLADDHCCSKLGATTFSRLSDTLYTTMMIRKQKVTTASYMALLPIISYFFKQYESTGLTR